jgi:hypothetical protein
MFKVVDIFILALGIIFPICSFLGYLSWEKGLIIGGFHSIIVITALLAKKLKKRIMSFIAYFVFVMGVYVLIDESGILYEGYTGYAPLTFYLKYACIGAVIGFIFKFRAYAISGALLGFWAGIFLESLFGKSITFDALLSGIAANYAMAGMGGEHLFLVGVPFILFGAIALYVFYGGEYTLPGGGYSTYTRPPSYDGASENSSNYGNDSYVDHNSYNDNYDNYNNYNNYDNHDDQNDYYSSSQDDEPVNHYGWSQSQIDLDNEQRYYGTPTWYEEKEIEENDYGKPWYARDEDDGYGRPAWARDDEEED